MISVESSRIGAIPTSGKIGWAILLAISAMLVIYGAFRFFSGPELMVANIAERTSLAADDFRTGNPSAYSVITLISQQHALGNVITGVFGLLVAWKGFRHSSRWAWKAMWVLVLNVALVAYTFVSAGGLGGASLPFVGFAGVALLGQLLSHRAVVL